MSFGVDRRGMHTGRANRAPCDRRLRQAGTIVEVPVIRQRGAAGRWRAPGAPGRDAPAGRASRYGPGGTCAALDTTTTRFTALAPEVLVAAQEEQAARAITRGLRRTTRTLTRCGPSSCQEREEAVRWRAGAARAPSATA
jgi:hypothetical protein